MSELITNKITPGTGSSNTVTLGDSGDTFNIPAGVTLAGSGASLTALPAANLTGTLPAIDGSSLTGITTGKVLQLAHTTSTFGSTTASASDNTYVDSSVTITFTPTTTASKLIVYFGIGAVVVAEPYDGGYGYRVKKVQDSTTSYPAFLTDYLGGGNHHGRRYFYDDALTNINNWHAYDTFTGVDADSHTTTSLTYTVQFAGFNVGTTLSVGNVYSARPQMIVWEVAN